MKPIRIMLVAVVALCGASVQAASEDAIAERIRPVGQVCVDGQVCQGVETAAATSGGALRSADEIVARHCNACHSTGLLGAPKIGDTAAWRSLADKQGGVEGMLVKAIEGINAMPPKGTCGDCSDDELRSAIEKMSGL